MTAAGIVPCARRAGCLETGTSGSERGPGKPTAARRQGAPALLYSDAGLALEAMAHIGAGRD
jgi:hypothetical protein